jgi:hypothetical protein
MSSSLQQAVVALLGRGKKELAPVLPPLATSVGRRKLGNTAPSPVFAGTNQMLIGGMCLPRSRLLPPEKKSRGPCRRPCDAKSMHQHSIPSSSLTKSTNCTDFPFPSLAPRPTEKREKTSRAQTRKKPRKLTLFVEIPTHRHAVVASDHRSSTGKNSLPRMHQIRSGETGALLQTTGKQPRALDLLATEEP